MTNNIVAQFACSLDSNGNFKEYRVVSGSVFNEEYNETLDSGTIILSQVAKEDRLSKIKPYDYVRVYDKSGNTGFDKLFLVDTFDEKENNIKEHIYGYTINVMSETKLLEKIQCPNLVITHDVRDGVDSKKTIWEHIKRYMTLFVPKIKYSVNGSSWSYEPLIKTPGDYHQRLETKTITINFSASDYEENSGHGSTWYVLEEVRAIIDMPADFLREEPVTILDYTLNLPEGIQPWNVSVTIDTSATPYITMRLYFECSQPVDGTLTSDIRFYCGGETEIRKRFNVPCADMAFNCPTLRQLLTTLMQQVGCIPIVKNRTLSFLDFQKDAASFADNGDYSLGNTVNYIRRSLSSDSYVNTLVNISDNVLDSGNEIICETLGFRDRNNVLLKQAENLKLETSLPIYKVNKCILRHPGRYSGYISSNYNCFEWRESDSYPVLYYFANTLSNGVITVTFCCDNDNINTQVKIKENKIYFMVKNSIGGYQVIESKPFADFVLNSSTMQSDSFEPDDYYFETKSRRFTFTFSNNNIVGFCFSGTFINENGTKNFSFVKFANDETNLKKFDYEYSSNNIEDPFIVAFQISMAGNRSWDISKLVVENSVRQLLERDFQKMKSEISSTNSLDWTLDNLSKYVYGTVGYSIGSKEIAGFSEIFNVGSAQIGWITEGLTYIENIINVLENYYVTNETKDLLYEYFDFLNYIYIDYFDLDDAPPLLNESELYALGLFIDYKFNYFSPIDGDFSGKPFFTTCIFDIYYQPLNSFNMSYVKSDEDVAIPLAQYDGNASGLTDFDRLSIHEQEQVDRIGNETLFITQRTTEFSQIRDFSEGPLLFRDNANRGVSEDIDYIIFKRSFTINNNCFNVSYIGTKDAVLKNYFTSIRTKYRAYQYVDYNASVLRKEKDLLFIRIAKDYYNGDNKILLANRGLISNFIYDLNNDSENLGYERNISYEIETNSAKISNGIAGSETIESQTVKNSVSLIATDNTLGIIYEYMDNVGAGPYIKNLKVENYEGAELSGIPQYWQIWADDYNDKHQVAFTNYIDFYTHQISIGNIDVNKTVIQQEMNRLARSPIVDSEYNYDIVFSVVDDNASNIDKRTFYKDYAERINHTVQFIYYAPDKDVLFNENFLSGAPAINRYEYSANYVIVSENEADFYNDKNYHDRTSTESGVGNVIGTYFNLITDTANGIPKLRTKWVGNMKVLKLCHRDSTTGKFIDIVTFRRTGSGSENIDYFFTINDTKTDKVFTERNGVLYLRYEVTTYTSENEQNLNRTVEDLYGED